MDAPSRVRIVEVGPRDGLQNEKTPISVEDKIAFIRDLIDAGIEAIEIGAFVRPDFVPQMANSEVVAQALADLPNPRSRIALVPNRRGLERAMAAGVRHVAFFTAASDAFNQANIRRSVKESLDAFDPLIRQARDDSMAIRGYVSTCWWCPYAGRVDVESVRRVAGRLIAQGCDEVSIADTIGAATPVEVAEVLSQLVADLGAEKIAVHFHDTRGTALANVLAALDQGISSVDASAGGLGGCPFAPGAQGNLATEDLVYMLHGMGIETGIDLDAVRAASLEIEALLGAHLPSRVLHAGPFTPRPS